MAIRFRKTKKILPGVKLNLSKSGVSVTAGVKGASINIGKDGVYRNLGIPGTGISKRDKLKFTQDKDEDYLEVLIDYVTDGEIFTLNVDATNYFPEQRAIYGYCEEVEGESIFYLNNIQRAIDVNSGNEIEDLQNFFSQLNHQRNENGELPIGKILVVTFILFIIAYIFVFTKN